MVAGGKPRHYLEAVRARYPLAMHGVSLSIGSTDPLDRDYLRALKRLMQEIEPVGDLIYGSEMSSGSGRFSDPGRRVSHLVVAFLPGSVPTQCQLGPVAGSAGG